MPELPHNNAMIPDLPSLPYLILAIWLLGMVGILLFFVPLDPEKPLFWRFEAMATGFFLGAGALHLLPESHDLFVQAGFTYPLAFLLTCLVVLAMLWSEHLFHRDHREPFCPWNIRLLTITLSFHALFEGIAMGVSTSKSLLFIVFLSIAAHKWMEALSLANKLMKSFANNATQRWCYFLCFAFATPLGATLGGLVTAYQEHLPASSVLQASLMALSSGTFIYIGSLHGLHHSILIKRCGHFKDLLLVLLGFGFMALTRCLEL